MPRHEPHRENQDYRDADLAYSESGMDAFGFRGAVIFGPGSRRVIDCALFFRGSGGHWGFFACLLVYHGRSIS